MAATEGLLWRAIRLASDSHTSLSVAYRLGSAEAPAIVFLNGLARPASSFNACIELFISSISFLVDKDPKDAPTLLSWDRYGQGLSEKQTTLHTAGDVATTLHELLEHLGLKDKSLILVGK